MSWDVVILSAEGLPSRDMADWPHGFEPTSLGEAEDVRAAISSVWPETDWSDPAWAWMVGQGIRTELNFQADGAMETFMLHVRGSEDPVPPILRLCEAHGWLAIDCSAGDVLDPERPEDAGYADWQAYRDRVLSEPAAPDGSQHD